MQCSDTVDDVLTLRAILSYSIPLIFTNNLDVLVLPKIPLYILSNQSVKKQEPDDFPATEKLVWVPKNASIFVCGRRFFILYIVQI